MTDNADYVQQHLNAISREAGLAVMNADGILGIIQDRETVPVSVLRSLTAGDVAELYERYIGPAVDQVEKDLKMVTPA